jgi:hypothetical protein
MKRLILKILLGRGELASQFTTLLKYRAAIYRLRNSLSQLESDKVNLTLRQVQVTTDLKAETMRYNDIRAALTKSFDL